MSTSIEWTDETWNPTRGCSRVSSGCDSCYAMHFAHRFSGAGKPYDGLTRIGKRGVDWSGVVRLIPEQLRLPLKWRKPRRVFVNSMSDLFHPALTDDEIAIVFGVMAACDQHTFQILTKRPERARAWFARNTDHATECGEAASRELGWGSLCFGAGGPWPLPNVWLGTSTENQETADERISELLQCPAAVRFVSAEPLLGPLDLFAFLKTQLRDKCLDILGGSGRTPGIDWVIVGGESGNGARPFHDEWARSIVEQCAASGAACFVKQLGSNVIQAGERRIKADRKGGDWSEWPHDLRVRQFPNAI
jgi:protein gp37